MSAVFLRIVNMSITASWLILAAIILRFLLKKAPKWIMCLLWAVVAVRLVCPVTIESVLSLVPSREPIPVDIAMSPRPAVNTGIPVINNTVNTVLAENFTPVVEDSANPLQIVIPILAIVWIVGAVVLLAYALVSYLRLRKTVSASFELQKGVMACDDVKAPFILGIFKPVVYVPSSMEGETLDYVLRHEQAHLSRRDHWWKPLGFLLLAVYWFNPLSWIAYILLCRDIESACDEKVIRDMDKGSMAAYSQALLDCSFSRRTIAACPLAFGEVGVKERIKGVLNYKKPAFWIVLVALVACVVVTVCFLTNPKSKEPDDTTVSVSGEEAKEERSSFSGFVLKVDNGTIQVRPSESSEEFRSSDLFTIPLTNATGEIFGDYVPMVGDYVTIEYNGYIYESYPATLGEIYSVKMVSRAEPVGPITTEVTYVGWSDELIVWDDAVNKDTIFLSNAIHLPVYKIESIEELNAFENKFADTMTFDQWHDDIEAPFDVLATAFDDEYFKGNVLLITYVSGGSGSFRYGVNDVSFDNGTLCVNVVQTYKPDVYTDDMSGWLFLTIVPRQRLFDIEKYDAVFAGLAEDAQTSAQQNQLYELQDFETESIVSSFIFDLTHDGIPDIVQVSYITTEGFKGTFMNSTFENGSYGHVRVFDAVSSDSTPIYEEDYARAHVGNGQFFITTVDGKDYLVVTSLYGGQGLYDYSYTVYSFEYGKEHTIETESISFEYGAKHVTDDFFDKLYKWINDDSVLLMATDIDLDFTFWSTEDNIVNPDEYYHRKISKY